MTTQSTCPYCLIDGKKLEAANAALVKALRLLYDETADYIHINKLGDIHHNGSMQLARAVLAMVDVEPEETEAAKWK